MAATVQWWYNYALQILCCHINYAFRCGNQSMQKKKLFLTLIMILCCYGNCCLTIFSYFNKVCFYFNFIYSYSLFFHIWKVFNEKAAFAGSQAEPCSIDIIQKRFITPTVNDDQLASVNYVAQQQTYAPITRKDPVDFFFLQKF